MNAETYKLAVFSLALIALGSIIGLIAMAFANGDVSTQETLFSTTLVGCITAIAGIVQVPQKTEKAEPRVSKTRHPAPDKLPR